MKFTDRAVQAIRAPATGQLDYFDESGRLPGFGVRVAASGRKAWVLFYRHRGRLRRLTLGTYPQLGVADARGRARDLLADVTKGQDPAGDKQIERRAPTFDEVAHEFIDRYAKAKRSGAETKRILERDVIPEWRTRRAKDITARDVRELLDGIVDRGAPIQANRTFAAVRKLFNWAAAPDRGLVPQFHNPCRGMEAPAEERQRDRVLSTDELRQIWTALDAESLPNATLFRLYLLTAQRGGELRTMKWDDVDFDAAWWTIPAERAKNGLTHRVPLSLQALRLLRGLHAQAHHSSWVFPTLRRSTNGHRANVYAVAARIRQRTGVDFTPHDLRRTAASYMTGMGTSRLTVAKILNHADRGVTAIYDRHSYDVEKHAALTAWAGRLEAIVAEDSRAPPRASLRA